MPDTFSALDQNLPRFTGGETMERKVQVIQDYLYQLLEALRYAMYNLDTRNFNQTEWDKFLDGYGSGLTDPVYKRLSDADGNLTKLELTAKGLQLQITNNAGDINNLSITAGELSSQISNAQGDISTLKQTANSLTIQISNAQGDISTLQQTAHSLTSQISNAQGDISTLQQTANSLTSQIASANGNISTLQQTANSLSSRISTAEGNISILQQTANSLSVSIANVNNDIYNLQITANGLSSTVADAQGRISVVEQTVNGLAIRSSGGSTVISGSTITMDAVSGAGNFILRANNYNCFVIGYQQIGAGPEVRISGPAALYFDCYVYFTAGGTGISAQSLALDGEDAGTEIGDPDVPDEFDLFVETVQETGMIGFPDAVSLLIEQVQKLKARVDALEGKETA